ncbi:SIR2-like domain-containing protein [Xylariaceae sp. FL0255]|nr:SIR2-like domain-containing protein [Xylariaceae sp. FL0255]
MSQPQDDGTLPSPTGTSGSASPQGPPSPPPGPVPIPPQGSSQTPAPAPAASPPVSPTTKKKRDEEKKRQADAKRKQDEERRIQKEGVEQLRKQLKKHRLAICVGSGVTVYSCPDQATRLSWWGLMSNALDYYENQGSVLALDPTNQRNLATARAILAKEGSDLTDLDRDQVCSILQELLNGRDDLESAWFLYKDHVAQRDLLDALRTLQRQGAMLFTTNYDDLLEKHCKVEAIDASDPTGLVEFRRGYRKGVFHPHGYWKNGKHIVLSPKQYWTVTRNEPVQQTLQHILENKTVLFVGCGGGLNDLNFGPLIRWAGIRNHGTTSSNYILLRRQERNPVNTSLPLTHLRAEGFDDISRFLLEILGPAECRDGILNEIPTDHEDRRIHDWLSPIDQSEYLRDLSNLEGLNRFDEMILKTQDVWELNEPSRVWWYWENYVSFLGNQKHGDRLSVGDSRASARQPCLYLDQPQRGAGGTQREAGETYMIIDGIEGLFAKVRDDYALFVRELATFSLPNLRLLVSSQNPSAIGNMPEPATSKKGSPKKKKVKKNQPTVLGTAQWQEIMLDRANTSEAMIDWARERLYSDPFLASFGQERPWILQQFRDSSQTFRWVRCRLMRLKGLHNVEQMSKTDIRDAVTTVLDPSSPDPADDDSEATVAA